MNEEELGRPVGRACDAAGDGGCMDGAVLHARLVALERTNRELLLALECTRAAVAICDSHAIIQILSRDAKRILAERDGLSSERGRIAGQTQRGTPLSREVEALARPQGPTEREDPAFLHAIRPSGKPHYALMLLPGPARHRRCSGRILVFITDPAAPPAVDASALEKLYGLTPREARVVQMLARGKGTARIARDLRLGPETVKTHLRAAYAKTESSGQAELISKILRSPASFERDA